MFCAERCYHDDEMQKHRCCAVNNNNVINMWKILEVEDQVNNGDWMELNFM